MKVEARHTFSIYLPTSLYQKLLDQAGKGKISTFIKQVLEEKLEKEEQQKKEKLRKQLIIAHQRITKNHKLKKELVLWDETADDYIKSRNERD